MGKGNFIIKNAIENPNINYIGIEMYDSVILRAVEKTKKRNRNKKIRQKVLKDFMKGAGK